MNFNFNLNCCFTWKIRENYFLSDDLWQNWRKSLCKQKFCQSAGNYKFSFFQHAAWLYKPIFFDFKNSKFQFSTRITFEWNFLMWVRKCSEGQTFELCSKFYRVIIVKPIRSLMIPRVNKYDLSSSLT